MSTFNHKPGPYTIKRTGRDTTIPHSACPWCHRDAISADTGTLLEFRCDRGHSWIQTRQEGLNHATFLARYHAGIQDNR